MDSVSRWQRRPWLMMTAVSLAALSGTLAVVCALLSPGKAVIAAAAAVVSAGTVWAVWQLQHRIEAGARAAEARERQFAAVLEQRGVRFQQWTKAVHDSVAWLLGTRLPAAWAGEQVPDAFWADESLRDLFDALFQEAVWAAQTAHGQWERDAESTRLAVVTLAQRAQTAAHRVSAAADQLAAKASDSEVVEALMRISHVGAQQARHAQSLQVLCGERTGQQWQQPLAVVDVVRAAAGRITDYRRVEVTGDLDLAVEARSVEELIHVVAELLANATQCSPPATRVMVHVHETQRGVAIRVDDGGVGLTERELDELRPIAAGEHLVELWQVGEIPRLGLPVVGALSRRLGLQVGMQSSPYGGVQVVVLVPQSRVLTLPSTAVPTAAPVLTAPVTTESGLPVRGRRRRREDPAAAVPAPISNADPAQAGALLAGLITSAEAPTLKEEQR